MLVDKNVHTQNEKLFSQETGTADPRPVDDQDIPSTSSWTACPESHPETVRKIGKQLYPFSWREGVATLEPLMAEKYFQRVRVHFVIWTKLAIFCLHNHNCSLMKITAASCHVSSCRAARAQHQPWRLPVRPTSSVSAGRWTLCPGECASPATRTNQLPQKEYTHPASSTSKYNPEPLIPDRIQKPMNFCASKLDRKWASERDSISLQVTNPNSFNQRVINHTISLNGCTYSKMDDSLFWVILVEHSRVSMVSISRSDLRKKTLPCVVPYTGFISAGDAGRDVYVSVSRSFPGSSHCKTPNTRGVPSIQFFSCLKFIKLTGHENERPEFVSIIPNEDQKHLVLCRKKVVLVENQESKASGPTVLLPCTQTARANRHRLCSRRQQRVWWRKTQTASFPSSRELQDGNVTFNERDRD